MKKVIVKYTIYDCVGNTFTHRCIHCAEVYRKQIGASDNQYFQCNHPELQSPRYLDSKYGKYETVEYNIPEWCPLERVEGE